MKEEQGLKRPKSPYKGWLIFSIIMVVWFLIDTVALILINEIGFAIYSLFLFSVWCVLLGWNLCKHNLFIETEKMHAQMVKDFEELHALIEKEELEKTEEPFEEFEEKNF